MSEREEAWDALHAFPAGRLVGESAVLPPRAPGWLLYAFDPSERAVVGVRKREWRWLAGLREITEGRAPK